MSDQESLGTFKVEPSAAYESFTAPAPVGPEGGVKEHAAETVLQPGAGSTRAVWIVHGMGQQVPFETLEQLAEGVIRAAELANPKATIKPRFREVRVGETVLQRVELSLPRPRGGIQEVHLYEYYWAPRTEGAVHLRDVVKFLWDAGFHGAINYCTKFVRALFEHMIRFSLSLRTPFYLGTTLAILAALTVINAVVVGTGASIAGIGSVQKIVPAALIQPLTAIASIVCVVTITFGTILYLAEMSRPTRGASLGYGRRVRDLTWVAFGITVATILIAASAMVLLIVRPLCAHYFKAATFPLLVYFDNVIVLAVICMLVFACIVRWWNVSKQKSGPAAGTTLRGWQKLEQSLFLHIFFYATFLAYIVGVVGIACLLWRGRAGAPQLAAAPAWVWGAPTRILTTGLGASWGSWIAGHLHRGLVSSFLVWPFLFLISAVVREFLVQSVGDVTAYISSNKIDRFEDIRKKIKDGAKESAHAVYSAKAQVSENFEYEKIAIVGHSLGSVIAYDTLNRLIADDALDANNRQKPKPDGVLRIAGRTCLFLTFGSPLDKVAFFFSVMGKKTRHIREQLAAVVQPMIQSYDNRPFPWINVYSRNDVFCGSLDFYDLPADLLPPNARVIENVRDEEALIPLVAHVEYWNNLIVWQRLLAEII